MFLATAYSNVEWVGSLRKISPNQYEFILNNKPETYVHNSDEEAIISFTIVAKSYGYAVI